MNEQKEEQRGEEQFYLFDLYSTAVIEVKDIALRPYLNMQPRLLLKSYGRNIVKFGKMNVNILERIANRIATSGHVGKKHKIITSWSSGKYTKNMKSVLTAIQIIEQKTKKNPLQVLSDAIVNGSPRDEITVIEHAGARYPQSVDTSPLRRIDLAIRWIVQGAHQRSFGKKKKMAESLADEIIKASENTMESYAVSKRNEAEKQADSAR